jgi:hypothetical protein
MENTTVNGHICINNPLVKIDELENFFKDSKTFLSLCKFLRSKHYEYIPHRVYHHLTVIKDTNQSNTFCIRDSSEKSSREQERPVNTFEVG